MKAREYWRPSTWSWIYAGAISLLILVTSFLLLHFDAVEIINLRFVYIPIVFFGILWSIRDRARHSRKELQKSMAFTHCFRTGFYLCLILTPFLLAMLAIGLENLGLGQENGRYVEEEFQTGFLISMLVEIFASMVIAGFVGSFLPGMLRKS